MKEQIEDFLKLKEKLTTQLKEWVKDESVSLEERWSVFIKSGLGKDDTYYISPDCIDWNRVTLYNNFYLDKYAVCSAERFVEKALDNQEYYKGDNNPYEDNLKEKLIRFFMIEKFMKSFENDW